MWAYGSRVNGRSHTGSDLDLVLRGPGLEKTPTEQLADFTDAVRESTIPFLIQAQDWARLPQSFHLEIERDHVALGTPTGRLLDGKWCWPRVQLGAVTELLTGFPFKSEQYTDDHHAPRLLRGDNVAQGTLRWSGAKRWAANATRVDAGYWLQEGDVVLAMDRPWIEAGLKYASVRRADLPALLVQWVARLRGSERLHTRFLHYVIGSRDFTQYVTSVQTGTAVPHISARQIKDFAFRLPSLSEQGAIAHILGTLDDKIELNRRTNETLEAMARALFKSWFVDFEPVRAKMKGRDPCLPQPLADLFPDRLVDSEAGEIPEGWEVRPLSEQVTVSKGLSYKGAGLTTSDCGIPLHNLNSIKEGGGYKPDGLKYYSGKFRQRHVVKPGNLIVANTKQGFDHLLIGYSAIVPEWSAPEALFSHHVFLIEIMPESPLSELWLHYAISASWMGDAIRRFSNGTTVNMLPAEAFCLANTIVASRKVIDAFCRIVDPMLKQQERAVVRSHNLAALRDRLLPKLISGDIRVRDAEREAEAVV